MHNHSTITLRGRPPSSGAPRRQWRALPLLAALAAGMVPAAGCSATPPLAFAQPEVAAQHPRTLWDKHDVAAYKASIAPGKPLHAAFEQLRAWGDKRIAAPLDVPRHELAADGSWTFPDFKRGYQDASGEWHWEWNFNGALQHRAADVSNLGMLYALTGDEKYAAFADRLIVALIEAYGAGQGKADANGHDHFAAYGFDGGDVAMLLAKLCQGYDLIYASPSLSADTRARVERDLIRPLAETLKANDFMYTSHGRWGMVCLYGLLIAGETLGDQSMIDLALYGTGGSADHVTGGFMHCFTSGCFRDGAIWGADTKTDDQMASAAVMVTVAELMRHHGLDLYDYQDRALKKPFDAALTAVGSEDAAALRALPGIDAFAYAYRHYGDARYPSVIEKLEPGFELAIGEHLPTPPTAR
jgi:hypothetical protein